MLLSAADAPSENGGGAKKNKRADHQQLDAVGFRMMPLTVPLTGTEPTHTPCQDDPP